MGDRPDFDRELPGEPARNLEVGEGLIVRLPGPWNGPLRVIERTPTSLRFATLPGHLEAGELEFRIRTDDRGLLWAQTAADPALVRAVGDEHAPIDGLDLLLVGRYFGLRFPMGVRIGRVGDGCGTMDDEVATYLDDGRVEFRIAASSQPATNPIVRAGLLLFGRPTQLRVSARALQRRQTLTAAKLTESTA